MVQLNELRVGNWIIDAGCGRIQMRAELFDLWRGEHAMPIPLTPEILEKAGFVHIEGIPNDYFKGLYSIRKEKRNGKYNLYSFYIHWDLKFSKLSEMSSLHQLQNLYFALTGNELEIKL